MIYLIPRILPVLICDPCDFVLPRHVGGLDLSLQQFIPFVLLEPDVLLHLFWPATSQPALWLALNQLVSPQLRSAYSVCKINRLQAPSFRNVLVPDLNLLSYHLLSNLIARLAQIWSLPHYALVHDHSHRIVIHTNAMVRPSDFLLTYCT